MKKRKKKNKDIRDKLHSRVIKYNLRNDNIGNGDYVGYCENYTHRGIVLNDRVCIRRHCDHYLKLYVGSRGRLESIE